MLRRPGPFTLLSVGSALLAVASGCALPAQARHGEAGGVAPAAPVSLLEQRRVYRSVPVADGSPRVDLPAHLFFPEGHRSDARRIAIVFVHGGGWSGGKPDLFFHHGRWAARAGHVGVVIGYRLTSHPGVTPYDCVADVKAAVRWVRAQAAALGVDPGRVVLAGDSAGGHLAAAAALLPDSPASSSEVLTSAVPDAVVLWNPITDTTETGWDTRPPASLPPAEVAGWRRGLSPLHHVRPGLPPLQILHGDADTVVPLAQSHRFASALRGAGNSVDLRVLPGKTHAFVVPGYGDAAMVESALTALLEHAAAAGLTRRRPE
jgi:acetyl esterase/lipase